MILIAASLLHLKKYTKQALKQFQIFNGRIFKPEQYLINPFVQQVSMKSYDIEQVPDTLVQLIFKIFASS